MRNKFKPILFSTEMVQAILEGKKTMTRRILDTGIETMPENTVVHITDNGAMAHFQSKSFNPSNICGVKGKFEIGDILYVRETLRIGAWNKGYAACAFDYKASPKLIKTPFIEFPVIKHFDMLSKALSQLDSLGVRPHTWAPGKSPLPWIPAIHMPKEAARIFLEVTDVRVERLRDISEEDAIAEGFGKIVNEKYIHPGWFLNHLNNHHMFNAIDSFASMWVKLNGKGAWKQNPWVWVYEFKVIEKPADFGSN
ncbi:ASCH domain-containing protein [Elizabethkingia anophelis]|uniref:ASCH domain-containing protein n=1 Tax=Elizabethkingia anophelis TaxID=1117645 RepID=UPI0022265AB4|nr:ASCH domain-containing protein [Elizabethkingia anophelis]MCW2463385.1 hypothetical protein [Elizabethkingia anophelis]MCW2467070.1 hypothetical protein [Elizabethkingia anophelis]MCW2470782.1 hypothetical protein [Elizabethkingia anophelis]HBI9690654.1 ASCH domain-containing protein [Elizabethkingia anophelis]HBI9694673.1 ASCH domain-containing protein [Elizabethkingia anophelis]